MTKKLITFIVTATLVAVFAMQQIALAIPLATFDPVTMSLDISGNIGDKAGTSYMVTIAVRNTDKPQFSKTNPPLGVSMFKTGYNGRISQNIRLPKTFEGGEYTAFFSYNINGIDYVEPSHFSYTNANESATVELLKLLNGEDSGDKKGATNALEFYNILSPRSSITKFGVVYDNVYNDSEGINKIPFVCEVTYSMKSLQPNEKFTFESLCIALSSSIIAYDIKTNGLDAQSANSSYLGELYLKLDKLSEDETNKLDSLLKSADYKGRSLSDIFAEKYIMSKLLYADTRLKMKEIIMQYHTQLGINISKGSSFDKVLDERKYIIYEGIMKEISDDNVLSDIKSYFTKYVKKALNVPNEGGSSSSKDSSSSSISGQNLTNPNTTTTTPSQSIADNTVKTPDFYDMNGHYAFESVKELAKSGIINGYADGSFKPDSKVTRAEFCKIVALAFNFDLNNKVNFNDVDEFSWYAQCVSSLAQNNIVTGYNGLFMPNDYITREDAAVIIHRIFTHKNIEIINNEKQFADTDNMSNYAKSSIGILANASIINGDGTKFYPKNTISRGETAMLVNNALKYVAGGGIK